MSTQDGPVVIGVTGPGENQAALRYAVEVAERDQCAIRLVHVVHQVIPPPPPSVLLTFEEMRDVGQRIVDEVAREVDRLTSGRVECDALVASALPVQALVDASADARVVVLQHRDLSRLSRIVTGSTVTGVAAHALCPVVSVPASWVPPREPRPVTVGVHESGAPLPVLRAAFEEARARGAGLNLVHAWRLDPVYDDIIRARVDENWRSRQEERLREAVEPLLAEHPGVVVEAVSRHEWPAEALVEFSAQSDLLVVGRHSGRLPQPQRLGSIARTMLRESRCPVLVVPVPRHGGDGEDAGTS